MKSAIGLCTIVLIGTVDTSAVGGVDGGSCDGGSRLRLPGP